MPRYLDTIAVGEYFAFVGGSARAKDVKQRTPSGWRFPVSRMPSVACYMGGGQVYTVGSKTNAGFATRAPVHAYVGAIGPETTIVDLSHLLR